MIQSSTVSSVKASRLTSRSKPTGQRNALARCRALERERSPAQPAANAPMTQALNRRPGMRQKRPTTVREGVDGGKFLWTTCCPAGWIRYMLKDRQKSAFDGFVDCIIIESFTIQLLTRRRSFGMRLFIDKA